MGCEEGPPESGRRADVYPGEDVVDLESAAADLPVRLIFPPKAQLFEPFQRLAIRYELNMMPQQVRTFAPSLRRGARIEAEADPGIDSRQGPGGLSTFGSGPGR